MVAGAQLVLALKCRGRVIRLEERAEGHLFADGGRLAWDFSSEENQDA